MDLQLQGKTAMQAAFIEHVNLSVSDPDRSAGLLQRLFGWRVRWEGTGMDGGRVLHVGDDRVYIAVYQRHGALEEGFRYSKGAPLNHVAIQVENLDAVERGVEAAGLVPFAHGDYEPGRRFYFNDHDDIEFEVVSYR
jgi:catechol 2,3-dioxygenase-like lactoylglutathione lyase family enzyme